MWSKTIVSNTSSLPEVVGDVGLTVEPQNIGELEKAIVDYLEDNVKYSTESVKEHLNNYNWKKIKQKNLKKVLTGLGGIGVEKQGVAILGDSFIRATIYGVQRFV